MWVLFLAVASFLAFVSIVLLLWLANTLEARRACRESEIHAGPSFAVLSITQAFEPVFAVLWEAPIHSLELIQSGGTRGIPVSRLRFTFNQAAACFPEIYDGFGFEQWLQFLEDAQFVVWNGQQVTITREGNEFLEYRFTTEALAEA
ncbi:MAG TPA: hypothetical protein VFV92_02330 [Candidatus Bathyarchaeia archaeon]|nr:hypothetical protein [Candidatus Bathyarchaeia archaeon]